MKTTLKIIFAGTLLFTFAATLRAQTNAVGQNGTSNAVAVTSESQAAAHAPAFVAKAKPPATDSDAVLIDNTGIHAGAAHADANSIANAPAYRTRNVNVVALAGIAMCVLIPVCIVGIIFGAIVRAQRDVQKTLRAMIEKGIPMTPELVDSVKGTRPSTKGNPFPRHGRVPTLFLGLILTGIGAALLISDGQCRTGAWMVLFMGGWIVFFIGIAFLIHFLIIWLMGRQNQNNQPPSQPKP